MRAVRLPAPSQCAVALAAVALALAAGTTPTARADGRRYESADAGFGLTIPDDWYVLARETIDVVGPELAWIPSEQRERLIAQVSTGRFFVFLAGQPSPSGRLQSVNLVISEEALPNPALAVERAPIDIVPELREAMAFYELLEAKVVTIDGQEAVRLDGRWEPSEGTLVRNAQVMLAANATQSFTITGTATEEEWESFQPIFDGVIASFEGAAPPPSGGRDWRGLGRTAAIGAVIGGLTVLLLGVLAGRKDAAKAKDAAKDAAGDAAKKASD